MKDMLHEMGHELIHVLEDNVKLIPFLFITYLVMELIEHKTSTKSRLAIQRAGYAGPVVGSLLGVVPQCGFSASAASLYAGKLLTKGTLIAVFLSTSDEMLPIFLSEKVALPTIFKILGTKVLIALVAGLLIDIIFKNKEHMKEPNAIHSVCEHEHCECEKKGVLFSSCIHTVQIFVFIVIISFILHFLIHTIGEDTIASFVLNKPVLGSLVAGIVGMIPNCASSVVLTQLYVEGIISVGTMMSGLLAGAGVGILVLLKLNQSVKDSLKVLGLLYGIGVVSGIAIDLIFPVIF